MLSSPHVLLSGIMCHITLVSSSPATANSSPRLSYCHATRLEYLVRAMCLDLSPSGPPRSVVLVLHPEYHHPDRTNQPLPQSQPSLNAYPHLPSKQKGSLRLPSSARSPSPLPSTPKGIFENQDSPTVHSPDQPRPHSSSSAPHCPLRLFP
jgi:hypothetical protein